MNLGPASRDERKLTWLNSEDADRPLILTVARAVGQLTKGDLNGAVFRAENGSEFSKIPGGPPEMSPVLYNMR